MEWQQAQSRTGTTPRRVDQEELEKKNRELKEKNLRLLRDVEDVQQVRLPSQYLLILRLSRP